MTRRYAQDTRIDTRQTRDDIEKLLVRYGASGFMVGWVEGQAAVGCTIKGKRLRFNLDVTERDDQKARQRWRALLLVIKAKLESIEVGISAFEDEFLANTVLPNGQTVAEAMREQIAIAYETKKMPPLLGFTPQEKTP